MTSKTQLKPRIAIYGIGQYGAYIARFAVKKGWPIVAAFNRAGDKVGKDLGQVIGLGRDLGVLIQDCESGDYGALKGKADIGVVAQTNLLRVNIVAHRRLLNAGVNVLCHGAESYFPYGNDSVLAAEIDALAQKNGVTFTGGGIWDMSRIWSGILVAGPCTEIQSLFHSSITDVTGQIVNKEQAYQIGVSFTVGQFMEKGLDKSPIAGAYKTIPEHVLSALGYSVTATRTRVEPVVFDTPIENALMGLIPAGDVVGSRIIGEIETKEGVSAKAEIELRLFREGEVEHMFWAVNEGMPHTRIRVERDDSAHATAANLFNRIPDVIAAPPGIQLVSQLGPLKHTALV